jgi:hypothetical protein
MDASLNIVELIENNPITKLSSSYNGKLLTKIQDGFTDFEQQLFVSSFYCFLNCDQKKDFVIELDNIWKWMGFNQKAAAKRMLEKNFVIDCDYKFLLTNEGEQDCKKHGGQKQHLFNPKKKKNNLSNRHFYCNSQSIPNAFIMVASTTGVSDKHTECNTMSN